MTVEALFDEAVKRAIAYLRDRDARPVHPGAAAEDALARFREPLPEAPNDAMATLALLDEAGSGGTVATTGGRYFGFVTGGAYPVSVATNWLATAWDQNTALEIMSPVAAAIERVTSEWLLEILDLPRGSEVSYVTGATMANATAIVAARDEVLRRHGWDAVADGLFGAPSITVLVGDEAHSTVFQELSMLGLGSKRVLRLPVDDQGRLDPSALPTAGALDGPAILCAQAGNVNTGASDPFDAIADWATQTGAWVHVDGAFGLWAAACDETRHLVAGIERADSWATDAHKWLNVPYDSGIAFVRDPATVARSLAQSASYLPMGTRPELMNRTPQSSQRGRAIDIWAVLRTLGRQGVGDLVARCNRHARRFAEGLAEAGYPVLNEVVLNQVLVSFGDAARTDEVIRRIQADGTCWCGPTTWQGRRAMRISVSSWATTDEDVERSLAAMVRCAVV